MQQYKNSIIGFLSKLKKLLLSFLAMFFFLGSLILISDSPDRNSEPQGALVFLIISFIFTYILYKKKIISSIVTIKDNVINTKKKIREVISNFNGNSTNFTKTNSKNMQKEFIISYPDNDENPLSNDYNELSSTHDELVFLNEPVGENENISFNNKVTKSIEIPSDIDAVDPLLLEAIYFVLQEQVASTSLLQRKFMIGYNRAANIIDTLESLKIIGPANGYTPRSVYYDNGSTVKMVCDIENCHPSNNQILNTDFNSYFNKIVRDQNIFNDDVDLDKVLEYVISQNHFDLNSFQRDLDFDFIKTSSYIDTLRSLELINSKNELTNKYSLDEIHELIGNAIRFNPTLVSEKKLDSLIDGYEFENFVANLLNKLGYSAEVTTASNDYGVDVIAKKDNIIYAIQCKYYSSSVGNSAVQEIVSGMFHYNAHLGVVVTNNYFTRQAKELAKSNRVLLWDREYVLNLISTANK